MRLLECIVNEKKILTLLKYADVAYSLSRSLEHLIGRANLEASSLYLLYILNNKLPEDKNVLLGYIV